MKPVIRKVADVSHLTSYNDEQTLLNRRNFMGKLFKAGVLVGVPNIILNACSDMEGIFSDDEEETGTGNPVKITSHDPKESSFDLTENNGTRINIYFDRHMDKDSVLEAFSINPLPPKYSGLYYKDNEYHDDIARIEVQSEDGYLNPLADNTEYTITLKDTAKDKEGNRIDGDNDGKAGGDYTFTFATGKVPPPTIVKYRPTGETIELSSQGRKDTSIEFSHKMDEESVLNAFSVTPIPLEYEVKYYDSQNSIGLINSPTETLQPKYAPNTKYTITIKGTARDFYGNFLDGNEDGDGGDDFSFSFITNDYAEPCSCQSYTCSCVGDQCGCQGHTCTCVGFDCPCQFAGCPMHGIY